MKWCLRIAALFCLFSITTLAASPQETVPVERRMTVTGTIDITDGGDVVGYVLDQPEKLPSGIVQAIKDRVPKWKFGPIPLQPAAATRSKMSLVFVAKQVDADNFSVSIASATFKSLHSQDEISIDTTRFRHPTYPFSALGGVAVSSTVHLAFQLDHQGKILKAEAEQVDLFAQGNSHNMERWRKALARACLDAAKHWKFTIPEAMATRMQTKGETTTGRVAIRFSFSVEGQGQGVAPYGRWESYLPGPRKELSWMSENDGEITDLAAMPIGKFHRPSDDRRLLTPLNDG